MIKRKTWALACLPVVCGVAWLKPAPAAESGASGTVPSRGRATALLTALFYHDSGPASPTAAGDGTAFASVPPRQAVFSQERARIIDFAKSLVYEGGYYPKEIYQLLGIKDAATARVARITRQLDRLENRTPDPWEVAGRVSRSGMNGASDHWAMAPGDTGDAGVSSPGTLAYLPALAVVYAAHPVDGREAAAQLAILKDDDLRAAPAARTAFSLLARVLVSQNHDKDEWLRDAAQDSLDADTERDIRSVRVKGWKYLRGEECAMGRLERAVHLWYKGDSYQEIMDMGRGNLRSRESLAYLAALAAATYGMESIPNRVIVAGSSDRQLIEIIKDLHDLAGSAAVLRVAPEE